MSTNKPTGKPSLNSKIWTDPSMERGMRDTMQQIDKYLGIGIVVETETGAQAKIRLNKTATGGPYFEYYDAGTWRRVQ